MDTTRVAWLSDHSGWGRMRTMTSLIPSAQTIHGPLQGLASFLAVPGFTEGVSSQTLVPGRKVFLSWWYCRRWRITASAMFRLAYVWAASIRFRSLLR